VARNDNFLYRAYLDTGTSLIHLSFSPSDTKKRGVTEDLFDLQTMYVIKVKTIFCKVQAFIEKGIRFFKNRAQYFKV